MHTDANFQEIGILVQMSSLSYGSFGIAPYLDTENPNNHNHNNLYCALFRLWCLLRRHGSAGHARMHLHEKPPNQPNQKCQA